MKIELENCKDLFEWVRFNNVVRKLGEAGYLGRTHHISEKTGKIERINPKAGWDLDSPWIHTHLDPTQDCETYYIIYYGFGFIPKPCLSCWKVVVKPRTVYELFQLYNLQCDLPEDVYCKCGTDVGRAWVENPYNGYFYTNSREQGVERYKQIRALVDEMISPKVDVTLKRYCTEYEIEKGDSKNYKQPDHAGKWEEIADKWIQRYPKPKEQPSLIKLHMMEKWIRVAGEVLNDQTYKLFTNGKPLYTQPRTYHEED